MLDLESMTFVVHIASLNSVMLSSFSLFKLDVHPSRRPRISGLIVKKVITKIPNKYVDFVDIFYLDLASKLLKHIQINNHTIELVNN